MSKETLEGQYKRSLGIPHILQGRYSTQQGFTYLLLLFSVAITTAALTRISVVWSQDAQREKERELISVGHEFRRAVARYYERSPGTLKRYPQQLSDLLKDERYLSIERHLRRIYADPMTGNAEWGIVLAPGGGIMGVHSLSKEQPIRTGGFTGEDRVLNGAKSYSEWHFFYVPAVIRDERGVRK